MKKKLKLSVITFYFFFTLSAFAQEKNALMIGVDCEKKIDNFIQNTTKPIETYLTKRNWKVNSLKRNDENTKITKIDVINALHKLADGAPNNSQIFIHLFNHGSKGFKRNKNHGFCLDDGFLTLDDPQIKKAFHKMKEKNLKIGLIDMSCFGGSSVEALKEYNACVLTGTTSYQPRMANYNGSELENEQTEYLDPMYQLGNGMNIFSGIGDEEHSMDNLFLQYLLRQDLGVFHDANNHPLYTGDNNNWIGELSTYNFAGSKYFTHTTPKKNTKWENEKDINLIEKIRKNFIDKRNERLACKLNHKMERALDTLNSYITDIKDYANDKTLYQFGCDINYINKLLEEGIDGRSELDKSITTWPVERSVFNDKANTIKELIRTKFGRDLPLRIKISFPPDDPIRKDKTIMKNMDCYDDACIFKYSEDVIFKYLRDNWTEPQEFPKRVITQIDPNNIFLKNNLSKIIKDNSRVINEIESLKNNPEIRKHLIDYSLALGNKKLVINKLVKCIRAYDFLKSDKKNPCKDFNF